MHVGISAYLWHAGQDYRAAGVSTYIQYLVEHLVRLDTGHRYTLFAGHDAPLVEEVEYCLSPVPTLRPEVRIVWEQTGLPAQARSRKLDVLHATVNVSPLLYPGPTVVTVHDLAFLRHPERFARRKSEYLRHAVRLSARRACRVIAVSQSTKRDVVDLLEVPDDRVSVVHLGVHEQFRPGASIRDRPDLLPRGLSGPFVLHVGTLEPRKNIDILIGAFGGARRKLGLPHKLVLVGARGWMFDDLFERVRTLGLENEVLFADFVPQAELPLWYNGADLFVYPSAYEGFGLPLLEAMSCGVPCITSRSSALEEVGGGACLAVEPGSEEDLEVAILRVLTDADLRRRLREQGLLRAGDFSWERAARETSRVYETVAGAGGS
ncbi:MAG: glycosyltransferase family 1 protein [Chloroflexota bacterium]